MPTWEEALEITQSETPTDGWDDVIKEALAQPKDDTPDWVKQAPAIVRDSMSADAESAAAGVMAQRSQFTPEQIERMDEEEASALFLDQAKAEGIKHGDKPEWHSRFVADFVTSRRQARNDAMRSAVAEGEQRAYQGSPEGQAEMVSERLKSIPGGQFGPVRAVYHGVADAGLRTLRAAGRLGAMVPGMDVDAIEAELEEGVGAGEIGEAGRQQADRGSSELMKYVNGMISGVASNVAQAMTLGPVVIGAYGLDGYNTGYVAAKEKGFAEGEAQRFAFRNGAFEAGWALLFNKLGLGGLEQPGAFTTKQTIKTFLKQTGAELGEEELTEMSHMMNEALSGVDPAAMDPDKIVKRMFDTMIQTLGTMGTVGAIAKVKSKMDDFYEDRQKRKKEPEQAGELEGVVPQSMIADWIAKADPAGIAAVIDFAGRGKPSRSAASKAGIKKHTGAEERQQTAETVREALAEMPPEVVQAAKEGDPQAVEQVKEGLIEWLRPEEADLEQKWEQVDAKVTPFAAEIGEEVDRGPAYEREQKAYEESPKGEAIQHAKISIEDVEQASKWASKLPDGTILEKAGSDDKYVIKKGLLIRLDENGNETGDIESLREIRRDADGKLLRDKNGNVIKEYDWAPSQATASHLATMKVVKKPTPATTAAEQLTDSTGPKPKNKPKPAPQRNPIKSKPDETKPSDRMSHGVGSTAAEAEAKAEEQKNARKEAGERLTREELDAKAQDPTANYGGITEVASRGVEGDGSNRGVQRTSQEVAQPQGPRLSYEEFAKKYKYAFKKMMEYGPDKVGSKVYTEEMAKLAEQYPEWADKVEENSATEPGKDTPKRVSVSSVDTPAQGELGSARKAKAEAYKKLKRLKSSGASKLDIMRANEEHGLAVGRERRALEAIENRAKELGTTTGLPPAFARNAGLKTWAQIEKRGMSAFVKEALDIAKKVWPSTTESRQLALAEEMVRQVNLAGGRETAYRSLSNIYADQAKAAGLDTELGKQLVSVSERFDELSTPTRTVPKESATEKKPKPESPKKETTLKENEPFAVKEAEIPKEAEPKKKREKSKKQDVPYIESLKAYFKPGAIVDSYGMKKDRVISFNEEPGGKWSVTVRSMKNEGGKWVDDPDARERNHFTDPGQKEREKAWKKAKVLDALASADQKGAQSYSLGEVKHGDISTEDVKRTFPGADVQSLPEELGWRVTFKSGYYVDIRWVDQVNVDWDAAEKQYGRTFSKKQRESIAAAGSFEIRTKDGREISGIGIMQLHNGLANDATLRHESVHLADRMGFFSTEEWQALVKKHSNAAKDRDGQAEDIAKVREAWVGPQGLTKKLGGWFRGIMEDFGLIDKELTAEEVHKRMDSAEFWARSPVKMDTSGRKTVDLVFGRPDLANPARDEGVRRQIDRVDEMRKQQGLPTVKHLEESRQEAEVLMRHPAQVKAKLLRRAADGIPLTDAETIAAKELLNREGLKALKSGDAEKLAEFGRLVEAYRDTGTAEARSFRARFDPIEKPAQRRQRALMEALLTPPQAQYKLIQAARESGNRAKADKLHQEWAQRAYQLSMQLRVMGHDVTDAATFDDPQKAAAVLGVIQSGKADWGDKAYEFWMNAILSAPGTQTANLTGNLGFGLWKNLAERFVEASVNVVMQQEDAAQFGEFKYLLRGMMPTIGKGFVNAFRAYKSETPYFEAEVMQSIHPSTRIETPNIAIGGLTGRIVRAGFLGLGGYRALVAGDEFFKTIYTTMNAGAQAYRIAKSEGLANEALERRVETLLADKSSEAWLRGLKEAKVSLFQERGKFTANVLNIRNYEFYGLKPFRWILPFVVTPANIFRHGIRRTPLGSISLAKKTYDAIKTGDYSKVPPRVAEQVIAWGVFMALAYAVAGGGDDEPWITGAAAESAGDRQQQYRTASPMSIKIGGKWYSYSKIEPFATTIAMVVDAIQAGNRPGDWGQKANRAWRSLSEQVKSKTFLSGIADIMDAFEGRKKDWFPDWASSFVTSWVPNVFKAAGRASDELVRERGVWGEGDAWTTRMLERTLAKTELGLSDVDFPKYDLFGKEIKRWGPRTNWLMRMVVPWQVREVDPKRADLMLKNWNLQNPEHTYYPVAPSHGWTKDGAKVDLNEAEYAEYCKTSGQLADKVCTLFGWKPNQPSKSQVDRLQEIVNAARKNTRTHFRGNVDLDAEAQNIKGELIAKWAQKLSRGRPVKRADVPEWEQDVSEAKEWLKDVDKAEASKAYRLYLAKEIKTPEIREQRLQAFLKRLTQ